MLQLSGVVHFDKQGQPGPDFAPSDAAEPVRRRSALSAINKTASAPMSRASQTSRSLTVKSLPRTGRPAALLVSARSRGCPPKDSGSVSTTGMPRRPSRRPRARGPATSCPAEGERRCSSAMSDTPEDSASASRKGRGSGVSAAEATSGSRGWSSAAASADGRRRSAGGHEMA